MEADLHPGPINPSLLKLQDKHKSQAIWDGEEVSPLRCRTHIKWLGKYRPSKRVIKFIKKTQFYGAHKVGSVKLDASLISALVERWRQETHTFHLTVGEATITLQDVQIMLGLRIDGVAVTGDTNQNWQQLVTQLLGVAPGEHLDGTSLKIFWLMQNFGYMPVDVDDASFHRYIRVYLLILFGTVLFPDKSGDVVQVIYLPLLSDVSKLDDYSWGNAVLATLYRNLCRGCLRGSLEIAGPLILLQLWSWERIAIGRPTNVGPLDSDEDESEGEDEDEEDEDEDEDLPSPFGLQHIYGKDVLGRKWLMIDRQRAEGIFSLTAYRDAFDAMTPDQFTWKPYTADVISAISPSCIRDEQDWLVVAPMVCFNIVEWHFPDRVLRQFGLKQGIPVDCDTSEMLHKLDRRGSRKKSWSEMHGGYIDLWCRRRERVVSTTELDDGMDFYDPYMIWYREHTRRVIGVVNPSHGAPLAYHPSSPSIQLITQGFANIQMRCEHDLQKALEDPSSINFVQTLTEIRQHCSQCLEKVGFAHLIQQSQQSQEQASANLDEHSPLIQYMRRRKGNTPMTPIMEGNTPGSSSSKPASSDVRPATRRRRRSED